MPTFAKGDRVKYTNEWLWGGFTCVTRRIQRTGTVVRQPIQDHSVVVLWDGRKSPDQVNNCYLQKAKS